jgi:hypothetical protein
MSGTYYILVGLSCGLLAMEMDMGQYHRNKQRGLQVQRGQQHHQRRVVEEQTTKPAAASASLSRGERSLEASFG